MLSLSIARRTAVASVVIVAVALASPALGYRLLNDPSTGRIVNSFTTSAVQCGQPFMHWYKSGIPWSLNLAGQGNGKSAAMQAAMTSWNNVTPAGYTLSYAGTTTADFVTDGINTAIWKNDQTICPDNTCAALTAFVLEEGQVITESDILLNDHLQWFTDGTDEDAQGELTHEFGHSLGLAHSDVCTAPVPVMCQRPNHPNASDLRILKQDDMDALNCVWNQYPVSGPLAVTNPAAGVHWKPGSVQTVSWAGTYGPFMVDMSPDNGTTWVTVAGPTAGSASSVQVTVPSFCSNRTICRVRRTYGTEVALSGQFTVVPNPTRPWVFTSAGTGFGQVSLRLYNDQPQIAYRQAVGSDQPAYYAFWNGTGFTNGPASSPPGLAWYTSLALASDGSPRIAYIDPTYGRKLLTRTGSTWSSENMGIDVGGTYVSLALNASNDPRVAFRDDNTDRLRFLWKANGTWKTSEPAGSGGGEFASLALNSSGNPRISFFQFALRYVEGSFEGPNFMDWFPAVTVDGAAWAQYTSLALDASNDPRIAYYDLNTRNLKYAFRSGGNWTIETVDDLGDVGSYASLALAPDGHPFISYLGDNTLKLAERVGGVWQVSVVDTTGVDNTSLRVTSTGFPCIAYSQGNALRFAGPDMIPPAQTTTLNAAMYKNGANLTWTAPGDDGTQGTVTSYVVKYNLTPFTPANFDASGIDITPPAPLPAGSAQGACIDVLDPGTPYWFGLRSYDDFGNASPVSNILAKTTRTSGPSVICGEGLQASLEDGPSRLTVTSNPNPAIEGVHVNLAIPLQERGKPLNAALFDLMGRKVKSFESGTSNQESMAFDWDRRDDAGQRVRPGVYMLRVRAGSSTVTRAIQLN